MISKIKKRDGRLVSFESEKIKASILKAASSIQKTLSDEAIKTLLDVLIVNLEASSKKRVLTVDDIQDEIEKDLIDLGHIEIAKSYILYRSKRRELREAKEILTGAKDDLKLSINSLKVLERRYLLKDATGETIETPKEMFWRVAKSIAKADKKYNEDADLKKTTEDFYRVMTEFKFLPNSPTLMNAGTDLGQLSACFVVPVPDDMAGIFEAVKAAAIINKTGGGTGFSFSSLRPQNDSVSSTAGVASGAISFMKVFNVATDIVKQGGRRRGANMGVLSVDHPDIFDFITVKEKEGDLSNFNISVGLTNRFMKAVEEGEDIDLINPRTGKSWRRVKAKVIFDLLVYNAWKSGDPGILFLDRINRDNPTPNLGKIEATNPCGEQPLLPWESCNLGSINLSKFVKDKDIDWEGLAETTKIAVHFLDNVIDVSKFPLKVIEERTKETRKIGLGVMGWADMLLKLNIPYDSEKALELAEDVMKHIYKSAKEESQRLAEDRGEFPAWKGSWLEKRGSKKQRNATLTTIAPTGSISIIAGASSGIEPLFAIVYIRNVMEGTELLEIANDFKQLAIDKGFYSEELIREIVKTGSLRHLKEVPPEVKRVFVTAHEIAPEWHVRMQAAFQKYTDNAVSKTINLPNSASPRDVEEIYLLAYKLGVKGITIYRDGCKTQQVLNINVPISGDLLKVDSEFCGESSCTICKP